VASDTSYERIAADYLVDLAKGTSVAGTSRCIIFGGFQAGVVRETVNLLQSREPQATLKVDPAYQHSAECEGFSRDLFLDRSQESFTTYRNRREGLSVLFPATLRGEERESTASVATVEPEDVRSAVGELLDRIPGAAERFGVECEGLKIFLETLADLAQPSLEETVTYILAVHDRRSEGEPTKLALGMELPRLGAFRWHKAFRSCNLERLTPSRWRKIIESAVVDGRDYAMKRRPNGSLIAPEDLLANLEDAADQFAPSVLEVLKEFAVAPISAPDKRKRALDLDWKEDRVELLFKRRSRQTRKLGEATKVHLKATLSGTELQEGELRLLGYIDEQPGAFDDEREQLIDFYNKYRAEIWESKRLANRWESQLYRKDVKDLDFLLALAKTAGQLVSDAATSETQDLVLIVRADASVQDILETVNRDAFWYFITRYRGVEALLPSSVVFELERLFQVARYDTGEESIPDFLEKALSDFQEQRPRESANSIRFKVQLARKDTPDGRPEEVGGAVRAFT